MATINNTIYPPIIPTYQKAFLKEKTNNVLFNIQFNISEYTTITDVQTIEVKVMTLEGNHSILKGDHYFKSAEGVINTITRNGSIDILRSDTVIDSDENIDINYGQFYIIQLRLGKDKFTGKNGDATEDKDSQNNFLTEEVLDNFSEWSTMSMIKCIDTPYLDLMGGQLTLSKTNRVTDMSDITGYLKWENKDASEFLYSYRFRVYDINDIPSKYTNDYDTLFREIEPLEDSGEIRSSTASPNRLHYIFRSNFITNKRYRMFISYETDNEYSKIEYLNFYIQNFISSSNLAGAHAQLSAFANREIGGNEITLTLDDSYLSVPSKYLVFRRSSSDTDFQLWDDIHTVRLSSNNIVINPYTEASYLNYTWTDFTAEHGVFYKYCVQEVDLVGNRAEKIMAVNYRNTDDYYKSVMEKINLETVFIDPVDLLQDVNYSLNTDIDNSFTNQDSVSQSQFMSNEVYVKDSGDYRFILSVYSEKNQKIMIKIEEYNKPGTYIKQKTINLEGLQIQDIDIDFTLLTDKKLRIVIDMPVSENGESGIIFKKTELHKVTYREIKTEKEAIDNLILDFNYTYLINSKNTLQLKFDTSVSSVTKTRKDTITETLNSKYPFIYRSGEIEYDSYNIEGTISILGDLYTQFNSIELQDSLSELTLENNRIKLHDVNNIFANEKDLLKYDDIYRIYKQYQKEYNLNLENDYNIEKLFRQKVEAFLTDGSPKLFKNAGLGNKLIMLTDVSLSPKETVGDKIYTFSATMTEIDDTTVENYNLYNIIDLNNWQKSLVFNNTTLEDVIEEAENVIGQYSYIPKQKEDEVIDIFTEIKKKYEVTNENYIKSVYHIYKVKIDLSELTHPISEGVMGEAIINNKTFIISENHPFLELDNIDIESFTLKTNRKNDEEKVVIDYLTKISTLLVYSTEGWVTVGENNLGQIYKKYSQENNNIYQDIYFKYYYKDDYMKKSVSSIGKLLIQAYYDKDNLIPYENVLIEVEDKKSSDDADDSPYIHLTDKDGIIDLYDTEKERVIKNILFKGIKIKLAKNSDSLKPNEYTSIDDRIFATKEDLFALADSDTPPQEHVIYKVGKLNLSFYYGNERLDYKTTIDKGLVNIEVNPGTHSASEVSNAIFNELNNGRATLDLLDDKVDKYIYIDGKFYKLDSDNCIQTPVWLKVTYLFEYSTRKKVE